MALPIRPARTSPKGRPGHGQYVEEFVAYPDGDGRADPAACGHVVFLDHEFPWTHLCLECGSEFVTGTKDGAKVLKPGDVVLVNSSLKPDSLVAEGVLLSDADLGTQRMRFNAIWGFGGWVQTGPELDEATPPDALKAKISKVPNSYLNKSVIKAWSGK